MSLFELFIIGLLATYCITFMLNSLNGPGDIFGRFRSWLGVRYDEHSNPYGTNWRAEAILCFYCLSLWVAFAITALILMLILLGRFIEGEPPLTYSGTAALVFMPFAMSGGAIFLKKWTG